MTTPAPNPQTVPAQQAPGVREKAVSGAAWTVAAHLAQVVLRMGGSIVLALVFSPAIFGIMQVATLVNQALYMLSDVGIGKTVVRSERGHEPIFQRTAWSVQIVRYLILTVLGLAVAYPAALYFTKSDAPTDLLFAVIAASAGTIALNGFTSMSLFMTGRELRVKRALLVDLLVQVTSLVVSLAFAFLLRSVWALVIGAYASTLARVVLSHTYVPGIRMGWAWDPQTRREILTYGGWIMVSTILTFASTQADRIFLGGTVTIAMLGLYGIAMQLATFPVDVISRVADGILMPAYSRARRDNKIKPELFDEVGFVVLTIAGLLVAGVLAAGPGFVRLVYKPDFHDAALLIPLLALVGWFRVLQNNANSALLALGKSRSTAQANLMKLIGVLIFMPLGLHLMQHPDKPMRALQGVILGVCLSEVLRYAAYVRDASREGLSPLRRDVRASLYLGVVAAGAMGVHWWMHRINAHPLLDMGVSAGVVVLAYALPAWKAWRVVAPSVRLPARLAPLSRLLGAGEHAPRKP